MEKDKDGATEVTAWQGKRQVKAFDGDGWGVPIDVTWGPTYDTEGGLNGTQIGVPAGRPGVYEMVLPEGGGKPEVRHVGAGGTAPPAEAAKPLEPWDRIPDVGWDRLAVQMLWKGYTDPEIGKKVGRASKTVTNRMSRLRQQYPELVPTRDDLRKRKLP